MAARKVKDPVEKTEIDIKKETKKLYVAAFRLWHPYQEKIIDNMPVELEMDSWLESQIKAEIIKEV